MHLESRSVALNSSVERQATKTSLTWGRHLIVGALATLLVALCAHISILLPFTPVPVTMQTFSVLLIAMVLGPLEASAALCLYLAEGAIRPAGLFSTWRWGSGSIVRNFRRLPALLPICSLSRRHSLFYNEASRPRPSRLPHGSFRRERNYSPVGNTLASDYASTLLPHCPQSRRATLCCWRPFQDCARCYSGCCAPTFA